MSCFPRYRDIQRTLPFISWNSRFTNPLQAHWDFLIYILLILPPIQYEKGFYQRKSITSFKHQLGQGEFLYTEMRLWTEAIRQLSFIKPWLKFSSPSEQRLFVAKQKVKETRLHQILKRFSWNTGTSFKSNLGLHMSLSSHRLYLTGRKKSLKDVLVHTKLPSTTPQP